MVELCQHWCTNWTLLSVERRTATQQILCSDLFSHQKVMDEPKSGIQDGWNPHKFSRIFPEKNKDPYKFIGINLGHTRGTRPGREREQTKAVTDANMTHPCNRGRGTLEEATRIHTVLRTPAEKGNTVIDLAQNWTCLHQASSLSWFLPRPLHVFLQLCLACPSTLEMPSQLQARASALRPGLTPIISEPAFLLDSCPQSTTRFSMLSPSKVFSFKRI